MPTSSDCQPAQLKISQIVEVVVPVSSPEVAEMTKIFGNVFRSVNIVLVNELAQLCENMGISVWEVIETASSKLVVNGCFLEKSLKFSASKTCRLGSLTFPALHCGQADINFSRQVLLRPPHLMA